MHFRRHGFVPYVSHNVSTNFGDDGSNTEEMPAGFFPNMHFRRHGFVPNVSPNISTKFGDDGSNTEEMPAGFRNPTWRQPPT